jgi:hypothetical protein
MVPGQVRVSGTDIPRPCRWKLSNHADDVALFDDPLQGRRIDYRSASGVPFQSDVSPRFAAKNNDEFVLLERTRLLRAGPLINLQERTGVWLPGND